MDNDTVEFIGKLGSVEGGILPDGIDTYEKITGKVVAFTIIESYDVSEIVVLKIFHVDIKNVIVGTEYYVNITYLPDFTAGNDLEPFLGKEPLFEIEFDVLSKKSDHIYNF